MSLTLIDFADSFSALHRLQTLFIVLSIVPLIAINRTRLLATLQHCLLPHRAYPFHSSCCILDMQIELRSTWKGEGSDCVELLRNLRAWMRLPTRRHLSGTDYSSGKCRCLPHATCRMPWQPLVAWDKTKCARVVSRKLHRHVCVQRVPPSRRCTIKMAKLYSLLSGGAGDRRQEARNAANSSAAAEAAAASWEPSPARTLDSYSIYHDTGVAAWGDSNCTANPKGERGRGEFESSGKWQTEEDYAER